MAGYINVIGPNRRSTVHKAGCIIVAFVPAWMVVAQSITPINRAAMETAFFNVDAASAIAAATADLDDDGVLDFEEMGCFGENYESGSLQSDIVAAFNANITTIDDIDGTIESTVQGVDLFIGYLTTVIGDGQGQATQDVIDLIDDFSGMGGGPGTNGMTLAALGFDDSQSHDVYDFLFGYCIDYAGTSVVMFGPEEIILENGAVTYTAFSIDSIDPFFTETHTFTSTNPGVLSVTPGGQATPLSTGNALIYATGDISFASAHIHVQVVHDPAVLPASTALALGLLAGALAMIGLRLIARHGRRGESIYD